MNREWLGSVIVVCFFITMGLTLPAAAYDSGVTVGTVLKSTSAVNGQPHRYLKTNRPEVTVAIVEIAPGAETGWHLHTVPVYAYVLEGTLKVLLDGGRAYTYEKGQAIVEVLDTAHNGQNVGQGKVRLIVFYTGEEGRPNAVRVTR